MRTRANDVIGTGPRLQVLTPDADLNRRVADAFEEWAGAIGFAEKLRTFCQAADVDGEGFALLITNRRLPTPVQLDLRLIEADRVSTPDLWFAKPNAVDGIVFDESWNPVEYHILKYHPGDAGGMGGWGEYDRIPADLVLHWFKCDRAEQARGVPEFTPTLPLGAQLRRFTLATLSAAEVAALFAVLLKTTMPPDDDTPTIEPFDTQELSRNLMAALPEGYEAQQIKPEHPATTYREFKREVVNEFARPFNMPFNVAAGNSEGYNYASGRLDHQVYHRSIGVDRYHLETAILDRIFREWLREARLVDRVTVEGLNLRLPLRLPKHAWFWDGFAHVDPTKEATAQQQRLANGTTSLAIECANDGYDWRELARQRAEERAYYTELGIPYPGDTPAPAVTEPDDEEGDEEEPPARARARNGRPSLNGYARG